VDFIPQYTRADVKREADRLFGKPSSAGIMKLLDEYECEHEGGRARVQMACMKLCEGQIEKLKHFIAQARKDFRDVLYWAEY